MKLGLGVGDADSGSHRSRRLLGVVILLLFIIGCIGLQVLLYLASSGSENKLWRVGILANSTADYSLDEILRVAPISPDILEELARDDARSSPTPSEVGTPPIIGQIVPTKSTSPGNDVTPVPSTTIQPTPVPSGTSTPAATTPIATTPGTGTPATGTTTPVPTTMTPTTKVPTTPVATGTNTSTPTPTTRVPTTPAATTTIPPTPTPTTRVPTTPVATTAVPPTPTPTTQAPTPTPVPTSTGVVEIPTPWVPPTEPPGPTEETLPGSGLDSLSATPVPPKQMPPTQLDMFYQKFGAVPKSCKLSEKLDYSVDEPLEILLNAVRLDQVRIKIRLLGYSRFRPVA